MGSRLPRVFCCTRMRRTLLFVVLLFALVCGQRMLPQKTDTELELDAHPLKERQLTAAEKQMEDIVNRVRGPIETDDSDRLNAKERSQLPEYNWNLWRNVTQDRLRQAYGGFQVSPHCYVPKGRKTCAPHFLIAGSMKCGTTSLYSYLLQHPQVMPLRPDAKLSGKPILADKEVRFFNDPLWSRVISQVGLHQSINNYYDIFPEISPHLAEGELPLISGDATPMYVSHHDCPYRALTAVPKAKIIILVRNPVDRLYSEFWFRQLLKKTKSDIDRIGDAEMENKFIQCIKAEMARISACEPSDNIRDLSRDYVEQLNTCIGVNGRQADTVHKCQVIQTKDWCAIGASNMCSPHSVRNSLYVFQIYGWLDAFGRENVLVLESEDFYRNTARNMERVARFLDIEPIDWTPVTGSVFNIVNPDSPSAQGRQLANDHSRGLTIGSSSSGASGQYPPLSNQTRALLEPFFEPYNAALSRLVQGSFWGY